MADLSRRSLIKGATLAGVAAGTNVRAAAPSDTLNVAAIGCGMMGAADIRSAAQAGANIVALCDVDDARAAPVYQAFPDATRYRDYRRLLEREKNVDAVIIATPDHSHAVIGIDAMQLGKDVYCEKPLAHTLYEVRLMTEAARQYGTVTQLGNQGHSFKAIREFKQCIESGAIGKVREVHAVQAAFGYSRIDALPRLTEDHPSPNTLDWDLWLGPAPARKYSPMYVPSAWRGWRQFGTGNMGDFVCHILDPVFWALDLGAPRSVVAEAKDYDPVLHAETFPASSKIRFEFPARGEEPPVSLTWYDGDHYLPPHAGEIPDPGWVPGKPVGALVIGDKGKIVYGSHGARGWHILGEGKMEAYLDGRTFDIEKSEPGLPPNLPHVVDWLTACKEGGTGNLPGSNFDYGGPLTEVAMLGDIALRMLGTELTWDPEHMSFPSHPFANQYLHMQYRDGWAL
jgi:predicted dehydrogenase